MESGFKNASELLAAAKYQLACAKATERGLCMPSPPASVSGLSKDFFTDIKLATSVNPFSRAAANVNRNEVYAAHNSCGKATVWLTVSPRDDLSFDVMWYALGPAQSAPHKDQLPLGSLRFATLNQHPVAAALQFEHILDVVVEHVIGWSREKHMPHARGGLFGIPKAWVFAVEEQGRLTLHTHILTRAKKAKRARKT